MTLPDPQQWQHHQPHPPHIPAPRKRRKWPWIVAGIIGTPIVLSALASGGSGSPSAPTAPTFSGAGLTPTAAPARQAGEDPQAAPAHGPATTITSGDGAFDESTYEVGVDITPGKWRTDGPPSGDGPCYWARLKNTDGDFDSIIANGNAGGKTTVTIGKTDGAFQLRGGGCTWTKV